MTRIALTGSLYGVPSERRIEAFWLMKLHTGNFGAVDLQPWTSTILGVLTLFVAGSGLGMLLAGRHRRAAASPGSLPR